ncbi:DNA alkylation repair protein [Rhizomonospora bruguierae]|uniref:DNA alkylation repair protein n=1 Tax=Rhizomonospora bruguierae TaxID=1581705 RepID=UPI001BCB5C1F|nr:DNA alkylation repair protein [Micromonospora sp. NBRC 107566]
MPLAEEILNRLTSTYAAAQDPARATAMTAYMREQFPFLGLPAPAQSRLSREVLAGLPRPDEATLDAVARACWALAEREYQYFACGLLRRRVKVCSPGFLATARYLVENRSWWDTVDTLAAHVVGPLVLAHPELAAELDRWIADENLWLVRTAILHQLTGKERTDADRLFAYCTARAGHPDFFIRKAIGWALREYAKTDPAAVRAYVRGQHARLSPLSVREALKNIDIHH